ncbi:RTA1 like protein-domain-containing protein [Hygrophoropsis aurantiaca]|uniref:RTA1 like protein-domain-containing protein n=1 Tax=Hygrophoropsis aurantiaca TaxID=72124 RepID=A0ACB8AMD9_9AGAM|nr:RTA1 like protein-domain-containing protein [Hygrophoropsis aurantiaca]
MTSPDRRIILFVLWLVSGVIHHVQAALIPTGPPADPFLDPKDDMYNPLRYIASNILTGIAFGLVLLIALTQTYWVKRYGAKWMLAMVIGEYTYIAGFGCRFGLHYHPDSEGIYIAEYLFIVLSPCAFIAANYVLLGRLSGYLGTTDHVLLPARRLTIIFVSSDITTFLIQAAGGSLTVSHNPTMALTGSHIFLAGLVLQLASFLIFSCIYTRFLYRVYTLDREVWTMHSELPWYRSWKTLAAALAVSCFGILIRSGYRVAELSQGFQGYLATTEAFFYALDTLPLVIAISVYVPFWPGRFIPREIDLLPKDPQVNSMEQGNYTHLMSNSAHFT